jgi:phosphotransferase system enzyme I (PtsI)
MTLILRGISASPGIAIGTVTILRWEVPEVASRMIAESDVPVEIERLRAAFDTAVQRLRRVSERVAQHAGPEEAAIFDVQIAMLHDQDLRAGIENFIRQKFAAEKAVDLVLLEWRQRFARHQHAMLRERVGDLMDLQIRLLSILLGLPDRDPVEVREGTGAILVTHDLTPSLTVQLDRTAIAGLVTEEGTRTSHVAILARSLGLPAVVGVRGALSHLRGGERAIVDGSEGTVSVAPTQDDVQAAEGRAEREMRETAELAAFSAAEAVTLDGEHVTLRANVDLPEEAPAAAQSGADGVGLMRTEFLVVGRAAMPDEDEQYREYRRVLEAFDGHAVVIRTYDIGGDKLPVGGYPIEPNPFLGWRAIRMCLDQPDLFKVQLRALLRAAQHGDLRIMLPLITSVHEVRAARRLLAEAAAELEERGIDYRDHVPVGVMIETPAAAVVASTLIDDVDFFSIGTNDLTQYTLAVDRGNANLAERFRPLHPAVLTLIQHVVRVAAEHRLDVAVCGEMASEPLMAFALLGLGLRQLSVSARSLPRVKHLVRSVHARVAEAAARDALAAATPDASEEVLRRHLAAEMRRLA